MKEYVEASNPAFAIGEYWDSLAYEGGNLCYNQGNILFSVICIWRIFFSLINLYLYLQLWIVIVIDS